MIGHRKSSRAAAVIAALLTPSALSAQTPPVGQQADTQRTISVIEEEAGEDGLFRFDFGVPASPSLNLLGQAEDKVTVVNGLKPFILQLPAILNGDENGQSLGIDFSPAWLLDDPSERTYTRYRDNQLHRILYRTHIGAAVYEGVRDANPANARGSRVTVGLSTSLLDDSDPLMATLPGAQGSVWQRCLEDQSALVAREWGSVQSPADPEAARLGLEIARLFREQMTLNAKVANGTATAEERDRLAQIPSEISEKEAQLEARSAAAQSQVLETFARSKASDVFSNCARDANLVARYGSSLGLGVGALWNGEPGRLQNLSSAGWVLWAAYRRPLGTRFQRGSDGRLAASNYWMVGLSGRLGIDEIVETGDATTPRVQANVFDGWGGIEYLSASSRLTVQVGYQVRDTEGRLASFDRERFRYYASFSQRIGGERSGVWLRAGYGHARTSGAEDDAAFTVSILFAPPAAANLFGTK